MSRQCWVKQDGHVDGPLLSSEVKEMAANGKIRQDAEISLDGNVFRPVSTIKSLFERIVENNGVTEPEAQSSTNVSRTESADVDSLATKGEMQSDAEATVDTASSAKKATLDIFLSYRRGNGAEIARFVKEKLERAGYSVFLDIDSLREGEWSDELQTRISECVDFVPLITEGFFDRCNESADVVRSEIELAIQKSRNIVPILVANDPFPDGLTTELSKIRDFNGVRYVHEYGDECVSKLIRMLKSGQLGLERLDSSESGPKKVVIISGLILSVLHGGSAYYYAFDAFLASLVVRPVYAVVSVVPVVGALFGASVAYKTDANRLYCGREWIVFWICYVPVVTTIAFASAGVSVALLSLVFASDDGGQVPMRGLVGLVAATCGVAMFLKVLFSKKLWRLPLKVMPEG